MDLKQICELVNNINMDNIQVEFPTGVKLTMSKNTIQSSSSQSVPKSLISSDYVVSNVENQQIEEAKVVNQNQNTKAGNKVLSPIVGTCYMAGAPGAKPFVEIGTKVKKGDVLCIVEAMKLMNEIESEFDGVVAEILIQNEHLVEYGQPMFVIV